MKAIGILTEDFRLFYDLAEALKGMGVPFTSLSFHHGIPLHVGVVVTSAAEMEKVGFKLKVAAEGDIKAAIRAALTLLQGSDGFDVLFIGVDPGEMPGIAVLAKGAVLETQRAISPEDAAGRIVEIYGHYKAKRIIVRIGHGDRENRNRILKVICGKVDRVEIVNEAHTTPRPGTTDMESAIKIARTGGYEVHAPPEVAPTPGKVRDVQRKSRIESEGTVTLSKREAEEVARGSISMQEAVRRKRRVGQANKGTH